MYKIGSIVELESATYELKHPKTGEGLGVIFTLAGPSHAVRQSLQSARVARAQKVFQRDGRVDLPSFEEQAEQRIEDAVSSVLGWTGADVDYTPAAARKWFSDPREGWVVRQLTEALAEQTRFIEDSAPA